MTLPPASSAPHSELAPGDLDARYVELIIDGMTGAGCVARIERSLTRLDVTDLRVDLAAGRASIRIPPGPAGPDELVAAVRHAGYDASHAEAEDDDHRSAVELAERRRVAYRQRTLWSLAATLPILALTELPSWDVPGWQWIALALTAPVVLWAGWPIHSAALRGTRDLTITPDSLAAFAAIAALLWSLVATLSGDLSGSAGRGEALLPQHGAEPHAYFDVAAVVTLFMLAIRWFEARAKSQAGLAARALHRSQAKRATLIDAHGETQVVAADAVRPGDRLAVGPGELIPTDGTVEDGHAGVDESLLTGDPGRATKTPGDAVLGSTTVTDGHLVIRATQPQHAAALRTIVGTLREAQYGRSPTQSGADRLTEVLVPTVAAIALVTFAGWIAVGESATFAFGSMLAVLVAGCPCALALAVSAPQLVGTGRGARLGLLLRGPQALEATRQVDVAVFGRASTLGSGRLRLESITPAVGISEGQVLRLVGAVESSAEHPAATAITEAALAQVGQLPPVTGFVDHGAGAEGMVADRRVVVGRRSLIEDLGLTTPPALSAALQRAESEGKSALAAGWYGEVRAVLVLSDPPTEEAAAAVAGLRALGVRPMLLTASSHSEALRTAAAAGIEEHDVFAEVLPRDRPRVIAALQAGGARVAVIGAGRRDDAALAAADLPVSVGTLPSDRHVPGGLTVVGGRPDGIAAGLRLGRRTITAMQQNIAAAVAVCVLAVPVAAAGYLSPLFAACVVAVATLAVIGNALRLRGFRR